MPRLIWTPSALADVQRLHRFPAPKNPDAARRAVHAIRTGVKILARYPLAGPIFDEIDDGLRQWLVDFGDSGYATLYRVDGSCRASSARGRLLIAGWKGHRP